MDVVRGSGNPLCHDDHGTAEWLMFGAVDVSWTPPLRIVV